MPVSIRLTELPPRTRQLTPDEMRNTFGGCAGKGYVCAGDSDCCDQNCLPADEGLVFVCCQWIGKWDCE